MLTLETLKVSGKISQTNIVEYKHEANRQELLSAVLPCTSKADAAAVSGITLSLRNGIVVKGQKQLMQL